MSSTVKSFRQLVGIPPSSASTSLLVVEKVAETRKVIAKLLGKYRQDGNGKNIVHVVHEVPAGAPVFTPGTALAQEFEELTSKPNEKVVTKNFPSSFAKTDLHDYLQGLGEVGQKIVLVGYISHICISTTARVGSELGYDVLVVRDAVGDRNIPGANAETVLSVVLSELADGFATIVSEGEISS
ncbi:unnamed protein product [Penicillium egyptiacum]|uniref:Isochorismatase-like domain-containing protein n=1 Tax=Penicillium egyptiacum TaxID=1303716 RepID=A0A9W4KB00_9EURO|nr:unnamed protein product [Penicillium egyptiacum]